MRARGAVRVDSILSSSRIRLPEDSLEFGAQQIAPVSPRKGYRRIEGLLGYGERSADLIFANIRTANTHNPAKFPVILNTDPESLLQTIAATEIPVKIIAAERKKLIVGKYR